MDLSTLSNAELNSALESLSGKERAVLVKILYHLIEIERRRSFREHGYASIFDYCTRHLKYSASSAYRRMTAARCLRDNPSVEALLASGQVTLCTLTTAAKSIENKTTKVEEIIGCSKREVERLVAGTEPIQKKPKEVIKPVVLAQSELPLFDIPAALPEERVKLLFSLSQEGYQRFESARARLSNSLKQDLSIEAVIEKLLDLYLKPKVRRGKESSDSRYIPRALRRAVRARDNGQCCFRSPTGERCTARHYLQVDHIHPFACGGKTELSNLRLLCSAHNQLLAEQYFKTGYSAARSSE